MTTRTSPRCPLGVSGKTLSSWRNDGLSPHESRRIAAHVGECPACQETLTGYDQIRRALRGQVEPDGHDLLWRDVRMGITQPATRHPSGFAVSRRSLVPRLATVAAVLALVVAFVAVFGSRLNQQRGMSRQTQPQQTPIVIQSGSLTWRQVIFPAGITPDAPNTALRVVEDAAASAYLCGAPNPGDPVAVWVTHDSGAHWSEIKRIKTSYRKTGCEIGADANDPNVVVINVYEVGADGNVANDDQWHAYASMDGGRSWFTPDALQGMNVLNLASFHEHIYAIGTKGKESHLYISDDQMRDWSPIDADLFSSLRAAAGSTAQIDILRVWANAVSGELLVEAGVNYRVYDLWASQDRGYTWSHIPLPDFQASDGATGTPAAPTTTAATISASLAGPIIVQSQSDTSAWRFCGSFMPTGNDTSGNSAFECTTTDGQQWTHVSDTPKDAVAVPIAIAPDGSLLATGLVQTNGGVSRNGSPNPQSLFRLAPGDTGSDQWTNLGAFPGLPSGNGFAVYANGNAVMIWTFPGPVPGGNQGFTATYP